MNYNDAYRRVEKLKKFYKNLLWFGIVAGVILLRKYLKYGTFDFSATGSSLLLTIWGIILTVKAVDLFVFDDQWERGIVEKELKDHKKPIDY
ncbi:2TM domain-containing protein [Chryseobacterium indologenes]|uniref:2TM domain-containing protein n=1 Tax=Chryseobacterium indologenes TaxID=253 RepID=A0A0N0IVJ0_CHRID|nr:2TM domain-containing protein [Chryseobacterium indologenes]KPE50571.1 hypothetical protein AOB46_14420 [Chryseobacterium indologenes]